VTRRFLRLRGAATAAASSAGGGGGRCLLLGKSGCDHFRRRLSLSLCIRFIRHEVYSCLLFCDRFRTVIHLLYARVVVSIQHADPVGANDEQWRAPRHDVAGDGRKRRDQFVELLGGSLSQLPSQEGEDLSSTSHGCLVRGRCGWSGAQRCGHASMAGECQAVPERVQGQKEEIDS
jgi:hypothetical protein